MRIFLTGFPGAGKTFLGRLWAEDNNLAFYDLDALIEDEERMPVEDIFFQFGENYFREKEAAILRNTDRFENCIIACGGGTPCFFDNMHWMNKSGITVFLNGNEENLYHQLVNDNKERPLVISKNPEDLKNFIHDKLNERLPFYKQSKIILPDECLNRNGFSYILQNL